MFLSNHQLVSLLVIFYIACAIPQKSFCLEGSKQDVKKLVSTADSLSHIDPDRSSLILNDALNIALRNRDTLSAIRILEKDKTANGNLGRYHKSYDILLRIISLAEEAKLNRKLVTGYIQLGRLYGFLKRKTKALHYINLAQDIIDKEISEGFSGEHRKIFPFYAKASLHRESLEYDKAEIYLDSCYQYFNDSIPPIFSTLLIIEKSYLSLERGKYKEAVDILTAEAPKAEKQYQNVLVMLHSNIGDAYTGLKEYNLAKIHYNKSIQYSKELNRHKDYSILVYNKLSELYEKIGNYELAINTYKEGQDIEFEIFDSRSENSTEMFAIQDKLLEVQKDQKRLLQEQKIEQLQSEERLFRFQRLSLIGGILFISLLGFLMYKSQKQKQESQRILNAELQNKIEKEAEYSAKIQEKNKQFLTFSSVMTHDLKSPLRTINSFASLAMSKADKEKLSPKMIQYLGLISDSSIRMSELINDAMIYSRMEIENLKLESIPLKKLINSLLPTFQYDIEKNNTKFNIGDLPTVKGDRAILKTVFQNIISNGLKYQPLDNDEHIPELTIWADMVNDTHIIYIKDNGIGINDDYINKIFTPFNRFHTRNEYEGTGLGLALCKRIMNKHGGDIELESSSEEGSTFKISFSPYNKE